MNHRKELLRNLWVNPRLGVQDSAVKGFNAVSA